MSFIHSLHDNLEVIAGIVGSLGVILGVPFLRRFASAIALGLWRNLTVGSQFAAFREERVRAEEAILLRLKNIEREVQYNGGGSMKDYQLRQESYRRHDFWTQARPAMELDGEGHVNLVSEAACRLFHVSTPEDLYRRSWLRFLDSGEVDEFLDTYKDTASNDSLFRWAIQVVNNEGVSQGKWEFRAGRIAPDVGGRKLYSGHWAPVDEEARVVADRSRWVN